MTHAHQREHHEGRRRWPEEAHQRRRWPQQQESATLEMTPPLHQERNLQRQIQLQTLQLQLQSSPERRSKILLAESFQEKNSQRLRMQGQKMAQRLQLQPLCE